LLSSKVDTTVVKAYDIAAGLGNPRAMNLVLLGALVEAINLGNIGWDDIIAGTVKQAFADIDIAAFKAGRRELAHCHQAA
jgi:indolepyruvate ferredoxin oxidoreductase beta subunit